MPETNSEVARSTRSQGRSEPHFYSESLVKRYEEFPSRHPWRIGRDEERKGPWSSDPTQLPQAPALIAAIDWKHDLRSPRVVGGNSAVISALAHCASLSGELDITDAYPWTEIDYALGRLVPTFQIVRVHQSVESQHMEQTNPTDDQTVDVA